MGDIPSFRDRQIYGGALAAPTYIDVKVLGTAGTAETVDLAAIETATGVKPAIVIFTRLYDGTVFFARYDGTAATVPSGDITDGTGSEINPVARDVRNLPSASFSLVSPQAGAIIQMAFYGDDAEVPVQQ